MERPSIGILAGMGPRSTAPFIDLVITECQRQYGARDDIDFPKMMICSQPAPFYEDRPTDHVAMKVAIHAGLQDLEHAGVDLLTLSSLISQAPRLNVELLKSETSCNT